MGDDEVPPQSYETWSAQRCILLEIEAFGWSVGGKEVEKGYLRGKQTGKDVRSVGKRSIQAERYIIEVHWGL